MAFSRREFIQRGTLLAAGAVIPLRKLDLDRGRGTDVDGVPAGPPAAPVNAPAPGTGSMRSANLLSMNAQSFAPYVNSGFSVQFGAHNVALTLLSVQQLSTPAAPINLASFAVMPPAAYMNPVVTDAFALQFSGPANIPQGTYKFSHGGMGEFSLLIVPGSAPQTYNAIINHLQSQVTQPPVGRQPLVNDSGPGRGRR